MKNIKKAKIKAFVENDELYIMIDDENKAFEDKYKFHIKKDTALYGLYTKSCIEHIEDVYDGGTFIVEDGNILDFRDNCYDGYYNAKVKNVSAIIGYTANISKMDAISLNHNIANTDYIMGKQYNKMSLIIGDIEYETGLWYIYNPFMNHIKMIPYIKNDDGMFCWHNRTVQYKYNKKYIDKLLNSKPYKKSFYTFENGNEEWMLNLYDYNLSMEINNMFKVLLIDLDANDDMMDDYEEISGHDIEQVVSCSELFNMNFSLLSTNTKAALNNLEEILEYI
jgi:hypothetical protein